MTYRSTGSHPITAVYRGDGNFLPSRPSRSRSVQVVARGTITSTMQWTFAFSPTYTKVARAVGQLGSDRREHRRHVPWHRLPVHQADDAGHQAEPPVDRVGAPFHGRHLAVGAAVNVQILRPGYIGKYYLFTMRARTGPSIDIYMPGTGAHDPGSGLLSCP